MSKKSLKIMVIGYYGHLNAGDDLLQQAMSFIFQDHKLMFTSWQPSVLAMNECDLIVIGGGSIWPGYTFFQHADEYARELKTPVMVLGLSAKRADLKVLSKTKKLIESALMFHVRDESTFKQFESDSSIRKGVDLFWWMPWSSSQTNGPTNGISTVALNLREWGQDWDPKEVMGIVSKKIDRVIPMPLYFGSPEHDANIKLSDKKLLESVGCNNVPDHWNEEAIKSSDFCIAMRYHAILMSVRIGIPVIGFDFHPKMKSFFVEHDIPELCVSLNDLTKLTQAIDKVLFNLDDYREKFRQISDFLEKKGQQDLHFCREILSKVEPKNATGLLGRALRKVLVSLN